MTPAASGGVGQCGLEVPSPHASPKIPRMTTLPTQTRANLPYVDPLHLLTHFAESTTTDLALLHSPALSLLAINPLSTFQTPTYAASDPLESLETHLQSFTFTAPHPLVGWLGFISYDLARTLESIPAHTPPRTPQPDDFPLLHWQLFHSYFLFNHADRTLTLHTLGNPAEDPAAIFAHVANAAPLPPQPPAKFLSRQPRSEFLAAVRRIQAYIADGDIYQANFAQRWTLETADKPHHLFRRLCQESPAPYAAYLRFSHQGTPRHVLSASPELFLTLDSNGRLATRPIKGTRPRFPNDPVRDATAREELLSSEKDKAELAMIVDLLRNDLGRVSDFGSVHVSAPRTLEPHPTVWHTVATIESTLRPTARLPDLLRALCPGGSITGAPKIRATQIIEELEPFRRNLYCGNIGIIGPTPPGAPPCTLALNIAIRTIQMTNNIAQIHAGAGIVADSNPTLEYEETLHKAAALLRALGVPPSSAVNEK
jgi:anthranilate/para-aminobenzoate synthase component I